MERAVTFYPKSIGPLVLRLVAVLVLLGWPQIGSAAGTWSVIPFPEKHGQIDYPGALAVDTAENLYVADPDNGRIEKRDAQGNGSVIATYGDALGQVDTPTSLAADTAGNLYVTDGPDNGGRVQKRDALL
jgi:DNA-binding beta-propeller fold protein YncE